MAGDFEIQKGVRFGAWLHDQVSEEVHLETEAWALDRVHRVADKLQQGRAEPQRLQVLVPWFSEPTAFTAPGSHIYFGRQLFERCATDEQAAFVIAHEIAHHDLGHVNLFSGAGDMLIKLPGARFFALAFHVLEARLYGPERECDADRCGLDLCVAAGFDGRRCLKLFDILEQIALYAGDEDMVYGPDVESDHELAPDADWKTKAKIWLWQKRKGYLPIRDRREVLLAYLRAREHSLKRWRASRQKTARVT